jgi:CheY-like chemotaxis protein
VAPSLRKPIQLILIEDVEVDAEAISRACRNSNVNCEIVRFHNGSAAIDALHGHFGATLLTLPFVILLDLDSPATDGLAFLDELRADPVWQRSIVFVLTTSTREEDAAAAYDRRVAGYLVKEALTPDYTTLCELLDVYEKSVQFPIST